MGQTIVFCGLSGARQADRTTDDKKRSSVPPGFPRMFPHSVHTCSGAGSHSIEGAADSEAQAILRARIVDSHLLFELPDRGAHGDSTLEFSLEVTGPDRALLRILNPPPNIRIKPVRFTRRSDSAMIDRRLIPASHAR